MVLVSCKLLKEHRPVKNQWAKFLGLQSSDDSSTLVWVTACPCEESRMTTVDFITALFYEVDEQIGAIPKHPEAHTSGPVRWSPWGCSMPSKAWATGHSIAG
jgi:hypothetical protein